MIFKKDKNLINFIHIYNKKIIFIIFGAFLLGIISRPYLRNIYYISYYKLKLVSQYIESTRTNCMPKLIKRIPKNSALIIGHAYGSTQGSMDRGDTGIAPKIKKLYELILQ